MMSVVGAGGVALVVLAEPETGRERIAVCGEVDEAAERMVADGAGCLFGTVVSRLGVVHPVMSRATTPAAMRTLLCMPEPISSGA